MLEDRAELLRELARRAILLHELEARLAAQRVLRDDMVLLATEAGLSRRAVAKTAGLSVSRVQQITEAARDPGGTPR